MHDGWDDDADELCRLSFQAAECSCSPSGLEVILSLTELDWALLI